MPLAHPSVEDTPRTAALSAAQLDALCINTIRFLSIDAVQKANSGHPGMPMGAAPMGYVLWTRFMKTSPSNPTWFDRDRFVLSAGHGSMLLYSLLYLCGFGVSLDDIKQFRQWGCKTAGHPELGLAPGVDTTTGPLGQGFANGVGMAMAEANLAARFNRPGFNMVDHFTYAIVSDGDMMEGVSSEAASLAGHLRLGKLIYLYDANRISLSAATSLAFSEDCIQRFQSYGWHTEYVENGNSVADLEQAISVARRETLRPSLVVVRTHLGYGSPNKHDSFEAHGSPLGQEEVALTKDNLGWPREPSFHVPEEALEFFRASMDPGKREESEWKARLEKYKREFPALAEEFLCMINNDLPAGWNDGLPSFPADPKGIATRVASGKVLNALACKLPGIIGGSADLDPSTMTPLTNGGDFEFPTNEIIDTQGSVGGGWGYAGRNLHFGVREHSMGAVLNGIAAHGGLLPFGATFLIFSDYMRPPMRLAAIMKLRVVYVFTHDSIGLGEDGATHQPVEHLAALRAIPNLTVIRPCDANETAVAWEAAVEKRDGPTALILSRQALPTLDRSLCAPARELRRGAYTLLDAPEGNPRAILIGTGSEVSLCAEAWKKLNEQGVTVRVVSMPSWELFEAQEQSYRDSVLLPNVKTRLAVEAGSPQGWARYVGDSGATLCMTAFGSSAPGPVLMREYGFTVENVIGRALELLRQNEK